MEKTTEGMEIDADRDDEDEAATEILRDRFRLCTISIAEAEAEKNGMVISQPIMACISDLAFKYAGNILVDIDILITVAKDLELFAQHAGRKSVNMEDVILCAHRNNDLAASLRSFCNDLKAKEPTADRKRRKRPTKETDVLYVPEE